MDFDTGTSSPGVPPLGDPLTPSGWNRDWRPPSLFADFKDADMPEEELASYSGIDGAPSSELYSLLNADKATERVLETQYGSHIRIGRDRMNEKDDPKSGKNYEFGDGYGPAGAAGCGAVDIVAGLNSIGLWTPERNAMGMPNPTALPRPPEPPLKVNPNYARDAARVYISAQCDVDRLFDLQKGTIAPSPGKSAAVVKADQVRIIGREGVKIQTGTEETNSFGRPAMAVTPINFIAGDAPPSMMQPLAKGKNVLKSLNSLLDRINQLSGIVDKFLQFQMKFNGAIMAHTHPDGVAISIGVLSGAGPTAFMNGSVLMSWDMSVTGFEACISGLLAKKDLMIFKGAMVGTKLEGLHQFSPKYICSRQVFTS